MFAPIWLAGAAAMLGQAGTDAPAPREGEISKADAEAFIAGCGERKFETSVESEVDGRRRRAKILLCAKPSDSDAQWIETLEKAASSVVKSPDLTIEAKAKLTGELQAEIGRLKLALPKSLDAAEAPVDAAAALAPAVDPPPVATVAVPPAPVLPPPAAAPLPKPAASLPVAVARVAAPPRPVPKLVVQCVALGQAHPATCGYMEPDERLAFKAQEAIAEPLQLSFQRARSDRRVDVWLTRDGLDRGQVVRMAVPREMCNGVVRAKFDILVRSGGAEHRLGTFQTRCGS